MDILGVSEASIDPDPLIFKSLGDGARQINYAKVYSGLYEHEGHVVPFVVVVKVGKPSERSKPGNRGKVCPFKLVQLRRLTYLSARFASVAVAILEQGTPRH